MSQMIEFWHLIYISLDSAADWTSGLAGSHCVPRPPQVGLKFRFSFLFIGIFHNMYVKIHFNRLNVPIFV
jgi:hypothetical protein